MQSQSLRTSTATFSDLGAIWNRAHPLESTCTMAKEAAKQLLSRCGNQKYTMHSQNRVLRSARLRDGSQTNEFLRCNPHWGGVSCADRGDRIHEVLTSDFLDTLIQRQGVCILYTHLGKLGEGENRRRFSPPVVSAFRLLAEYAQSNKIRVTTTRRLLDYLSSQSQEAESPSSVVGRRSSAPDSQPSTLNPQSSLPPLHFPDVL